MMLRISKYINKEEASIRRNEGEDKHEEGKEKRREKEIEDRDSESQSLRRLRSSTSEKYRIELIL